MRTAPTILVLLALLAAGCGSRPPLLQRDNLVHVYGRGPASIRLDARVHHSDAGLTTLYFKLNTADLLYKGDGEGGPFKARVRITYGAFAAWSSRQVIDSASTLVQDRSDAPGEERELIGSMQLRRRPGSSFVVKVAARDLNRDNETVVMLRVHDGAPGSQQYFMPIDPATGLPLFEDHLPLGRPVALRNEAMAGRPISVTRHPLDAALPMPVFSQDTRNNDDVAADSAFTVPLDSAGKAILGGLRPGAYRFCADSATGQGDCYVLTVLETAFPYVDEPHDLLRPLRYITSTQEYERMTNEPDARKAMERFWLDAAGDRERAREAIRIYYGRVENANRHFSSVVEGWRTDRGLVHIIFGTPTSIYRSETGETWTYGEENNIMSLSFNFVKRPSALSDNDYRLDRDPMFKGAWYRNVESWRNGRVHQN
ncbi:MAG: GWxTD domain-containing protein [Flavobacteriales bacterium]|jgi:GWxTD domain-containing protein|nr:MAG: GWxTD domain-containing protein [Flavobacteriales bacterium]